MRNLIVASVVTIIMGVIVILVIFPPADDGYDPGVASRLACRRGIEVIGEYGAGTRGLDSTLLVLSEQEDEAARAASVDERYERTERALILAQHEMASGRPVAAVSLLRNRCG